MPELSRTEREAIELIKDGTVEYQSDLTQEFGGSKKSSTAAQKLEEKGLIKRKEKTWVYKVKLCSDKKHHLDNRKALEKARNQAEKHSWKKTIQS